MKKTVARLFLSPDGVMESLDQWHFADFHDEMSKVVDPQEKE